MTICNNCGASKYYYDGKYYCPNCDEKPSLEEERDEMLNTIEKVKKEIEFMYLFPPSPMHQIERKERELKRLQEMEGEDEALRK